MAGGWRWLRTLALLALGSWLITHLLDYSARTAAETKKPAGMVLGMLHGACMPATWPMLVLGKDTVIYAPNNDGRPYKLGYTLGVNLCGAVFFGLWFWRWQRWRQGRKPASCQAAKAS
ncbi:MAG: hypothetical protein N3J91_04725 [Verrucomicrobiae bacterium]|nr:hypothetical protein [Verrucomicrobiae bacterium]